MSLKIFQYVILVALGFAVWSGCGSSLPKKALQWDERTFEERQVQIRFYDTTDEFELLIACVQLLQDLGFELEEAEEDLGLVVGGKTRSARDAGQEVARAFYVMLTWKTYATDELQRNRASIVVSPAGAGRSKVRVTFQRSIYDEDGRVTKLEQIKEPELYQRFFAELDKSIFLTGNME